MMAHRLAKAVEAVCPIVGVAIGNIGDKGTWRVDFAADATPEQVSAALSVMEAFDPASPQVPSSVTPRQARMALLAAGLLDQVEAAVAAGSAEVRIAWEYGLAVERNSPFIAAIAGALGLSDADLDALFAAAASA